MFGARRALPIFYNSGAGGGAGDVMPPAVVPETPPAEVVPAPARGTGLTCGFCDCVLMADGAVLRSSPRARALVKAQDTIDTQKATIADLEGQIRALKAAAPAPSKRRILDGI